MEIEKYIPQTEKIFLGEGTFKDDRNERIDFIKNLETCDLLAVPGSGKTTALIAKLYCMAQNMPFEDGSGILVLAHTNNAVEEIEKKLKKHCPQLFEYPNFVGTIQSFVNKFLANQACFEKYGSYIRKNEDELILNIILNKIKSNRTLLNFLNSKKRDNETLVDVIKDIKYYSNNFYCNRFGNSKTLSFNSDSGSALKIIYDELKNNGSLFYNDSFDLANNYIVYHPEIKDILQKRFKYVFIDEMQDLEDYQIKIIDDIFFAKDSKTIIQRIGDKNQSIYNSVKENCDWITRQDFDSENYTDLSIQNSMRLSPKIGELVDNFVLNRPENYNVIGNFEESTIPPYLILIDHSTTGERLKTKFKEIIEENKLTSNSKNIERGFHIISWTTEKEDVNVLCLKKLFPNFSKEGKKNKDDFDCLKKYLFLFNKEKLTLEAIRKSILNSFTRILDLEEIKDENGRRYRKSTLMKFFKNYSEEFYCDFNAKLFKWCFEIVTKENYSEIYNEVKSFIESDNFIGLNWYNEEDFTPKTLMNSRGFINKDFPFISEEDNETEETEIDNYPIPLSSVHAVKGQTHCATMYVESVYQRPKYETQKIIKRNSNPLMLEVHRCNGSYDKQALKMMYVGFSRPTHLLCFAVLKENIQEHIENLKIENGGIWQVIDLVSNE